MRGGMGGGGVRIFDRRGKARNLEGPSTSCGEVS